MVKHSQLIIDSLFHPKKLAAYRLLSIGKVIQYVFLLIGIVTIFSFVQFVTGISADSFNIKGLTDYVKDIQWLLYPFAFILLTIGTTFLFFLQISIYALIGIILLKGLHRRGEYRHMWRTAALAITWSTLLSIIFPFFPIPGEIATLIGFLITFILLIFASMKYPKVPKK